MLIVRTAVFLPVASLSLIAVVFWVNVQHGSDDDPNGDIQLIRSMMDNYRLANGHNVPAYTVDKNGNRMHCWRALLLPFCGDPAVAAAYSFDKPWSSVANEVVGETAPDFYVNSSRYDEDRSKSHYKAVLDHDKTIHENGFNIPTVVDVVPSDTGQHWTSPQSVE